MTYARVRDTVLNFEISGQGEPLLMISGIGADHTAWSNQVPVLSAMMMTVTFDNRGTGKSDAPDVPYSIGMLSEDALGLMDVIGVEQAHVMGQGMGGRVALQMALSRPSRVRSLVLSSSSPRPTPFEEHLLRTVRSSIQSGMSRDHVARFEVPWLMSERFFTDPRVAEAMARVRMLRTMGTPPGSHARQIQAELETDLTFRLHEVKAPTLVIAGRRDLLVPPEYQQRMAEAIPGASLQMLDAAHLANSEQPLGFNAAALAFYIALSH